MSIDQASADFARMTGELVSKRIEAHAVAVDEEARFPAEGYQALASIGAVVLHLPESIGGAGASIATSAGLIERVARACGSTAAALAMTIPATTALGRSGSASARPLPDVFATGQKIPSWVGRGITASTSGGDLVLRGEASWVASAEAAHAFIVVADIEGTSDVALGVVEPDHPGLTVGDLETDLGLRGCGFRSVAFRDVTVPVSSQLARGPEARRAVEAALDHQWLAVAALAIGLGAGALEKARTYASERKQFGRAIGDFPAVRAILTNADARIGAARHLMYAAAAHSEAGLPDDGLIRDSLLSATEAAADVSVDAVQVLGGYGFVKEYPVERFMRDAHLTRVLADSFGNLRQLTFAVS